MLKWAVHNARPSYLAAEQMDYQGGEATDGAQCHVPGRRETKLRRKSSTLCWRHVEKENVGQLAQLTSTPLPGAHATAASLSRHVASPLERSLKRVQSLKDLSNILPEALAPTAAAPMLPQTPPPQPQRMPAHYASTLPTFEAEYSPCGLIPGPLLALRGIGIPDSYFEKPRYLAECVEQIEQHGNGSMTSVLEEKPLRASCDTATKQHTTAATATNAITNDASNSISHGLTGAAVAHTEQSTLSSSKMGDVTLERMIDAILASTRKERTHRHRRHGHGHAHLPTAARRRTLRTMRKAHASAPATASGSASASATATAAHEASPSPTYRQAYDPASDLSEYWRSDGGLVAPSCGYQEREVRGSPALGHSLNEHQQQHQQQQQLLRRQRAVRRKRQIAVKISTSVRQSAQKLLAAGRERVSGKVKHQHQQQAQQKQHRHVSPDSGHNSTSDFDEDEQVAEQLSVAKSFNANWLTERHESLDATKRRLSFSVHDNLLDH